MKKNISIYFFFKQVLIFFLVCLGLFIVPVFGGVVMMQGIYFLDLGIFLLMVLSLLPINIAVRVFKFYAIKNEQIIYGLGLLLGVTYMLSIWVWFYIVMQGIHDVHEIETGLNYSGVYWPWEDWNRLVDWFNSYVSQEGKRAHIVFITYGLAKITGLAIVIEWPGLSGNWLYAFLLFETSFIIWFIAFSCTNEMTKPKPS